MKAILLYYRELSIFNIPFSLLIGFLVFFIGGEFLAGFSLTLITGGMILAVYFYDISYKEKYYFYFNKGLSKPKLLISASILNVLITLIIFKLERLFNG